MRTRNFSILILMFLVFATTPEATAQGFLKKIKNAAEKVEKNVNKGKSTQKSTSKATSSQNSEESEEEIAAPQLKGDINGIPLGNFGFDEISAQIQPSLENAKSIELDNFSNTYLGPFSDDVAIIIEPNKRWVVDKNGNKRFSFEEVFEKYGYSGTSNYPERFYDGRVLIATTKKDGNTLKNVIVILDTNGNVVKELPNVKDFTQFMDGAAIVTYYSGTRDNHTAEIKFVDIDGNFIFPQLSSKYTGALNVSEARPNKVFKSFERLGKTGLYPYPYYNSEGKSFWGARDKNGTKKVTPKYSEVWAGRDGMLMFKESQTKRYGFVSDDDKEIIPAKFSKQPKSFTNGLSIVENNQRELFFMDKNGNLIPMPFDIYQEKISSLSEDGYILMKSCEKINPFSNTNWESDYFYVTYVMKYDNGKFDKVAATKAEGRLDDLDTELSVGQPKVMNQNNMFWLEDTYGYDVVDTKGNFVYDNLLTLFNDGLALVYIDSKTKGYMTPEGNVILKFKASEF